MYMLITALLILVGFYFFVKSLSSKKGYVTEERRITISKQPHGYKRPTMEEMKKEVRALDRNLSPVDNFTKSLKESYRLRRLNHAHV